MSPSAVVPKREAAPVAAARTFRVVRVAEDDMLNVRSGPSEYTRPVGVIAPGGRGVTITGPCQGYWCPIRHGGIAGWVNSYYLEDDRSARQD
jgi:uncharacterized protein YraI